MLGEIVSTRDCQQLALEVEAISKCVDVLRKGIGAAAKDDEESGSCGLTTECGGLRGYTAVF